jgi:secondary thiamine-phosphate synthase enzyme
VKSYTEYLNLFIQTETDFVNITASVVDAVKKSNITEGLCLVNSMHVSSSVFVHNAGIALERQHEQWIDWMRYLGHEEERPSPSFMPGLPPADDNEADPLLRRQALGRDVVVAITEGRLDFGPSEQIFYGEFDGKRPKRVLIKIIGE